jgi:hypothetical protein
VGFSPGVPPSATTTTPAATHGSVAQINDPTSPTQTAQAMTWREVGGHWQPVRRRWRRREGGITGEF